MAAAEENAGTAPRRRALKPLLSGIGLALLLGSGGFYVAYSGRLPLGGSHAEAASPIAPMPEIAFVPLPPLTVTLGPGSQSRYLRFSAELEVPEAVAHEVEALQPRVLDVLNGYLRAVDSRQLDEPAALIRLRAQMLRRVQIVAGDGRVRDLLVTEFVLN